MHNSETLDGEIAYRRERLLKIGSPSSSTYRLIFVAPLLVVYWLIRLLFRRATGRSLPESALRVSADADESTNCAGSRRASSRDPLACCSECGKYVGLSDGRLFVHRR